MKKINFIIVSLLLTSLLLIAFTVCTSSSNLVAENDNNNYNSNQENEDGGVMSTDKPISKRVLNKQTSQFAYKLFYALTNDDDEKSKNPFISPLSIGLALSMTYNGAREETKEAIAKALELDGFDIDRLNETYKDLMSDIKSKSDDVEIAIANSLWGNKDIDFNKNFIDKMKNFYSARVESVNFGNPNTLNVVNNWISENTNDMIKDMLSELDKDTALLLINAIYFNGKWTNEFSVDDTEDREFTLLDESKIETPMMHKYNEEANYYEQSDYKALRLPYGEDMDAGMYILLPKDGKNIYEIVNGFNKENWTDWTDKLKLKEMEEIALPKFKIEYKKELKKSLSAIGMGKAFNQYSANFRNMSTIDLYISKVIHQAVIDVNEKGTEASAATVVVVTPRSTNFEEEEEQYKFIADKPFLFLIKDEDTDAVLFMGILEDPS
jgi:serine protease inhibitor